MSLLPQAVDLGGSGGGASGRQGKQTETADTKTSLQPANASAKQHSKKTRKKGIRKLFDFRCFRRRKGEKKLESNAPAKKKDDEVVRHGKQGPDEQEEHCRGPQLLGQPLQGSTKYITDLSVWPARGTVQVTDSVLSKDEVLCGKGKRMPGKDSSPYSNKFWSKSPSRNEEQKPGETRRNEKETSLQETSPNKSKVKSRLTVDVNNKTEHERKMQEEAEEKSGDGMYLTLYVFFCLFLATAVFLGVMYAFPVDEEEASFLTPQTWDIFRVELISAGLLCFGALVVLCLLRSKQSFLTELLMAFIMALLNLSIVHLPRLIFSNMGEFRYFVGPLWLVELVVPLLFITLIVCLLATTELCYK